MLACTGAGWTSNNLRPATALSIVKPPASLTIRHGSVDVEGEMVGPVSAGDTVTLACLAHGSPPPTVAWYRDGVLLDATSDYQDNVVINTVNILHVCDMETRVQSPETSDLTSISLQPMSRSLVCPLLCWLGGSSSSGAWRQGHARQL